MKLIKYLALSCLISPALYANELTSFSSIIDTLTQGGEIIMVAENSHCKVDKNPNSNQFLKSSFYFKPSAVAFDEKHISFAGEKFWIGDQYSGIPEGGIMQRFSIYMNSNGEFDAVLAVFDPENNKRIPGIQDMKIKCQLGDGLHFYQK